MRNAVFPPSDHRPAHDERQALREAIRQLERAAIYIDAVAAMDLADAQAARAVNRVRNDLDGIRHYLIDLRAGA
jgi:hypothetical protein